MNRIKLISSKRLPWRTFILKYSSCESAFQQLVVQRPAWPAAELRPSTQAVNDCGSELWPMALANGHFTVSPFAHVVALRVNLNYHSSWRPSRLKSDGQTSVLLIFDLSSVNCCRLCHARGVHAIASILESLQFGPFPFGPDTAWHQSRWWSDIIQGCNQQDFPVVCQLQPNEPITLFGNFPNKVTCKIVNFRCPY